MSNVNYFYCLSVYHHLLSPFFWPHKSWYHLHYALKLQTLFNIYQLLLNSYAIASSNASSYIVYRSESKIINQNISILYWDYFITGYLGWNVGSWAFCDVEIRTDNFVNLVSFLSSISSWDVLIKFWIYHFEVCLNQFSVKIKQCLLLAYLHSKSEFDSYSE